MLYLLASQEADVGDKVVLPGVSSLNPGRRSADMGEITTFRQPNCMITSDQLIQLNGFMGGNR
jgi:hypothetical protein